jgi:hypothetical protein
MASCGCCEPQPTIHRLYLFRTAGDIAVDKYRRQ